MNEDLIKRLNSFEAILQKLNDDNINQKKELQNQKTSFETQKTAFEAELQKQKTSFAAELQNQKTSFEEELQNQKSRLDRIEAYLLLFFKL
jgi:hypothetical protein